MRARLPPSIAAALLMLLAGCATPQPPPPLPPPPAKPPVATPKPPPRPAWQPRKVVPDAVAVPGGRLHTVKPGETGIAIARAYGVGWAQVASANKLRPPYVLEIGDKLLLPSAKVVAAMTVEQRAAAFRIDIDDLITGSEPAASAGDKAAALSPPPPAAAPRFAWPVEGRILSGFGAKPGGRYNDGINLKASRGTTVRAAEGGVVAYAGEAIAGFGKLLLIKHDGGWVSAYAHNEALLVARGDQVARGEPVARAGATGAVAEPQLHFELRRGRTAVDPVKLLPPRG